MKTPETAGKIEAILRREFAPSAFMLEDQSYMHAGHNPEGGGGHYFVELRSARFNGLAPLARQRLVMDSVKELMDTEIHALSMKLTNSAHPLK
jgi:BolA protein